MLSCANFFVHIKVALVCGPIRGTNSLKRWLVISSFVVRFCVRPPSKSGGQEAPFRGWALLGASLSRNRVN